MNLRTRLILSFLTVAVLVIAATVSLLYWQIRKQFNEDFHHQAQTANEAVRQELPRAALLLRNQVTPLQDAAAIRELVLDLSHNKYDKEGHAAIHRQQLKALQASSDLDLFHVRWAPKKKRVRDVLATHHSGVPALPEVLTRYAAGPMTTFVIAEQPVGIDRRPVPVVVVGVKRADGLVLLIGRALDLQFLSDIRSRAGGQIELTMRNADDAVVASTLAASDLDHLPGEYETDRVVHTNEGDRTPAWILDAHSSREPLNRRTQSLVQTTWVVSIVAVVLALLFGIWFARRLTQPINQLVAVTQRVATGDRGITFPDHSGDEVGRLIDAFQAMISELEANENRLKTAERIAAWEEIARELAHEIKNPLTPIQMSIETMRRSWQRKHEDFDQHFDESTVTILEEVERLKNIVSEFREFARMPTLQKTTCDVVGLIERTTKLLDDPEQTVHITTNLPPQLPSIQADSEQLTQVLQNLIQNAIQACERASNEGPVHVSAQQSAFGGIEIRVEDTGDGIPTDDLPRVFSPYYSRREGGSGLGLAISHRIVSAHGGRIGVSSNPGQGARFVVQLPTQAD